MDWKRRQSIKQSEEEKNQGVPPHWNTYFTVSNVDQIVAMAIEAKGTLLFGPMDVFTAGRMAMLQDPPRRSDLATPRPYRLSSQGRAGSHSLERISYH